MSARAPEFDAPYRGTEIAMIVALSVVLGNMRIVELPQGGSIAFGTLPILVLAIRRGFGAAAIAGGGAGLLHAMMGGTIIHPIQFLLDYGCAYAVLAAAAIAAPGPDEEPSKLRCSVAVIMAMSLHLLVVTISGAIFFAQYLPAADPFAASAVYNALTVVPETVLALLLVPVLVRAAVRADGPRHSGRAVSAAAVHPRRAVHAVSVSPPPRRTEVRAMSSLPPLVQQASQRGSNSQLPPVEYRAPSLVTARSVR